VAANSKEVSASEVNTSVSKLRFKLKSAAPRGMMLILCFSAPYWRSHQRRLFANTSMEARLHRGNSNFGDIPPLFACLLDLLGLNSFLRIQKKHFRILTNSFANR
jgi:hypothetical protein